MKILACILTVSLLALAAVASAADRPPNIVYILADDLGYGDVSCFNPGSKIQTVHIDGLAREGIRLTDAHSGSAVCTPTRYGIMTGRYTWRSRLKKGVLNGYSQPLLEPGRVTVASFLESHGYETACVGKWHLGLAWQVKGGGPTAPSARTVDFTKPVTDGPNTHGFDYSFIIPASLDMPPYLYLENDKETEPVTRTVADSPRPAYYRGGPTAATFDHGKTLLEVTKHATAWLDQQAKSGKPLFLYVPLTGPHTPHMPRAEFVGKSGAGNYGDFVLEVDWSVGQILDAISRNGLAANTLVVVTSDNGAHSEPLHLEEKYGHKANADFRGQKSDAWDGGHHIPFVARWPGRITPATSSDRTVSLVDLFATTCEMLQLPVPPGNGEDSFSLLPLLLGKANAPIRPPVVMHSNDGFFAIKQGPWKLVLARGSGGWTLPEAKAPPNAPPVQLYNTQDDPGEKVNLYDKHPEIVGELEKVLGDFERGGRSVSGVGKE